MSRRGGVVGLAASILIACVCAGLIAWRLTPPRPHAPTAPAPAVPSPVAALEPPVRLSTIIDLPGDPVLVRRGAVLAPKDALISVPARLGQQAPQTPAKAFFVNSTLVSSTGGYMGKFQEAGQEAEALAAQLAMNSAQIAAAQDEPDTGSDDDGGAETSADAQSQFLTTANSNELEINLGGSRGQPQLKETILKPLVADTISNLLIANGFDADSARMIESAAKDSPAHIQTLPPQATAVAVGALDIAGGGRAWPTCWTPGSGFSWPRRRRSSPPQAIGRRFQEEGPVSGQRSWMGATHFRMRILEKVRTEMSLHVLAYYLKRMIAILGAQPLIQAMRAA